MKNVEFKINGQLFSGLEVPLPGAPLVLAYSKNGFVMCGYLNIEVANKLNISAAMVRGVKTVDDLLVAPVQAVSVEAQKKGVIVGDTGQQALLKLG